MAELNPSESGAILPTVLSESKPTLSVEQLTAGGFELAGRRIISDAGDLKTDRPLMKAVGVYAFVQGGVAMYVGVATMGLAKRLYFYSSRPGVTQRTSRRLYYRLFYNPTRSASESAG